MNLKSVEKLIPLASQTYSKCPDQFPMGPNFLTNGVGNKVKDDRGRQYTDWIMGLGAITLGYRNKEVEQAICVQALNGISFSLPHPIEYELAKLLVKHLKVDMVRFAKNGSDVTSAAVRLARACTNYQHIAHNSYHGSQDWSVAGTSMDRGVPLEVQHLTHSFDDVESLEILFRNHYIAGVVVEVTNPASAEFLKGVKALCKEYGAVLIFDEVVTWPRLGLGGVGERFGVKPDLICIGKGMGNGMPISALCGTREMMRELSSVFMSSTFGGETLSIAAAIATIKKFESANVAKHIENLGITLMHNIDTLLDDYGLHEFVRITGHHAYPRFEFSDPQVHTLFKEEVIGKGHLIHAAHMLSLSHTRKDVNNLLDVYKEVFKSLKKKRPRCRVSGPVFSLR